MPSIIRQILSAFVSESLDDIASKADALVLNDQQHSALQRHNDSPDTLFPVVRKLAAQVEKLSLQVESLTLKPDHYKPVPSTFFSPPLNRHNFPDYSQSAKRSSTLQKLLVILLFMVNASITPITLILHTFVFLVVSIFLVL